MADSTLRELKLKPVYYSRECDMATSLQVPLLERSLYYDRGVGFFTSGWIQKVAVGISTFAANGGVARVVTSPKLDQQDWSVIVAATLARRKGLVQETIARSAETLVKQCKRGSLEVLAWMITDGLLEFRFAVPRGELQGGDYHPKIAFFRDNSYGWAVHGSMNDSSQAFLNDESVSVFPSSGDGAIHYHSHFERFEQLWRGEAKNIELHTADSETLKPLLRLVAGTPRPYKCEAAVNSPLLDSLRPYQLDAIASWEKNGRVGILEMATGTGKTYTAIAAALRAQRTEGKLALVVLVPYIHLVDQWSDDLKSAGFEIVCCMEGRQNWRFAAKDLLLKFQYGSAMRACWVATHATACTEPFSKLVGALKGPRMIIADEMHGLGSPKRLLALCESIHWRLGLSATPKRWHDESGTAQLFEYFDKVVFDYGIGQAIESGFLVQYEYEPVPVDLDDEEMLQIVLISREIARALQMEDEDRAHKLALQRARALNACKAIVPAFLESFRGYRQALCEAGEPLRHVLVYCAPGTHREVLRLLANEGVKVHEFVAETRDRKGVLERFTSGELQVLVAMKCLDEGVDVPQTKRAYVLASSTNPREFVQRRGRILRPCKEANKKSAHIVDFMVARWSAVSAEWLEVSRSLMCRCLPRFAEFSLDARNSAQARSRILSQVTALNLLSWMDKRPWEVYQEALASDPTVGIGDN